MENMLGTAFNNFLSCLLLFSSTSVLFSLEGYYKIMIYFIILFLYINSSWMNLNLYYFSMTVSLFLFLCMYRESLLNKSSNSYVFYIVVTRPYCDKRNPDYSTLIVSNIFWTFPLIFIFFWQSSTLMLILDIFLYNCLSLSFSPNIAIIFSIIIVIIISIHIRTHWL